jgi:excisionase family DNA binding protein
LGETRTQSKEQEPASDLRFLKELQSAPLLTCGNAGVRDVSPLFHSHSQSHERASPVAAELAHYQRTPDKGGPLAAEPYSLAPTQPRLLTIAELAVELRISRPTAYRLVHEAGLPVVRLLDGGDLRVDPADLDRWLEDRKARIAR